MAEQPTLVLRKKKKTHTYVKVSKEEAETEQPKDVDSLLRAQKSDVSLPESIASKAARSFTAEENRESDIMSRIFDDSILYESDYSTTETDESASQHGVPVMESMYVDLLQVYGGMPDIDEVSEDIDSRKSVRTTVEIEPEPTDEGIFVDPLTGETLYERKVPPIPTAAVVEVGEMGDEEEEEEETETVELQADISMSEDSEILQLLELEKIETQVVAKDELQADSLEDFLTKLKVTIVEKPNFMQLKAEKLERERVLKIMMAEAEKFLNTLIGEVVDVVEYKQPMEILRNNLDKHAVMEEILEKVNELEVERTIRAVLNRRAIEFYKRKRLYQAITDDLPDQVMEYREKLNYATKQLDRALGMEHAMKMKWEHEQSQLNARLTKMQESAQEKEDEFKALVLQSLVKEKGNSEPIITNILNEMFTTYNEVCKTYHDLIQVQHTKAELQKKDDYIEYGKGLKQYVILQTETKDLHKKVEDRSVELGYVRARCNRDIHALSNIKVKGDIARIINGIKKQNLACLLEDKKKSREKLVHLKEERLRLQRQIRDLTFQTGLSSKPVLLKDYDSTVEQAEVLAKNIAALRKQKKDLLDKIAKIETKCKAREARG
ncbi:rho-associated protein kinase 1-like [Bactrocera tryoni]|uniref:rho-associated protein kinase 1-like n=1 Tax=Bactrocera tryoni TaxID=59916 RepID=UPI001A96FE2C|nr:rho-associated protein kinase 1-like [Bactrocera tryoni]